MKQFKIYIAILILCLSLIFTKFAFIFILLALMPSIIAIIIDNYKTQNKCFSSTIIAFNLMGALPYIISIFRAKEANNFAKFLSSDVEVWLVIYGSSLIGIIFIWTIPEIIASIYSARSYIRKIQYTDKKREICELWGIKFHEAVEEYEKRE